MIIVIKEVFGLYFLGLLKCAWKPKFDQILVSDHITDEQKP